MYNSKLRALILLLLCSTTTSLLWAAEPDNELTPRLTPECTSLIDEITERIDQQQANDAQTTPINNLPFLRSDRFLASFKHDKLSEQQLHDWLSQAFKLGIKDWQIEMANAAITTKQKTLALACANNHIQNLKIKPSAIKSLITNTEIADNYNDLKQALGLYPIFKIPVQMGVNQLNIDIQKQFQKTTELNNKYEIYNLFKTRTKLSAQDRQHIVQSSLKSNSLNIPTAKPEDLKRLISFYAPAFAIETTGTFDRIAQLQYDSKGSITANTLQPTIYTHHAYTRMENKNYLQLIYTAWFPSRPDDHPVDIYSGLLDGLMWRVTLDHNGDPLLYDSVHPCGCYHKIYPVAKTLTQKPPEPGEEIAFVLTKDIPDASKQPLLIHLNARAHFVEALTTLDTQKSSTYEHRNLSLRLYDELRSLPTAQGSKSLFEPNGLVAGTERREQWLIWPMGVEEAGAMRQWGTHATAFVSRRHFDEARLFERFFSIQ